MISRILLALLLVSCASVKETSVAPELSLAFDKAAYKTGEQITATIMIKNPGKTPIDIMTSGHHF